MADIYGPLDYEYKPLSLDDDEQDDIEAHKARRDRKEQNNEQTRPTGRATGDTSDYECAGGNVHAG